MGDRITRELTPFVEVLRGPGARKPRLLRAAASGDIYDEDGRAVLRVRGGPAGGQRLLLDADAPLWDSLLATDPEWLELPFEVHLDHRPDVLPEVLTGRTLVVSRDDAVAPLVDAHLAVALAVGAPVPAGAREVHLELGDATEVPALPVPTLAWQSYARPDIEEQLPALLHGMGTGRVAARELRLRVDPLAFQERGRRPPFLSEVIETIANALAVPVPQLTRELAFRARLLETGIRRHLLPDPYLVTLTFRGHRSRGLVPATTLFSLPSRGSRKEVLRGTPESEHEHLGEYLEFLEDPGPRLLALATRELFAVSIHVLPNPDVPLVPNHGGIARWRDGSFVPYAGR